MFNPTTSTCIVCGKTFTKTEPAQKCCSPRCSFKHHREYRNKWQRDYNRAKKPLLEKTCPICGKTFTTTKANKVYCSLECYREQKRKLPRVREKACLVCEKIFSTDRPDKLCCSDECQKLYRHVYNHVYNRLFRNRHYAPKPLAEKTCQVCGKNFFPTSNNQKYCSRLCYQKYQRDSKRKFPCEGQCPICGKTFVKERTQIYCSKECAKVGTHNLRKRRNEEKHPEVEKTCTFCGTSFRTRNYHQKFCSAQCRNTFFANKFARKYYKRREPSHYEVQCLGCGKTFSATRKNQKFCSVPCRYNYTLAERRRKNFQRRLASQREFKCLGCGKPFSPSRPNQKHCSKACLYKRTLANQREQTRQRRLASQHEVYCPTCKKAFLPVRSTQRFCSRRCYEKSRLPLLRELYRKKAKAPVTPVGICSVCGKTFVRNSGAQKFCSDECRKKHSSNEKSYYQAKLGYFPDTLAPELGSDTVIATCAVCGKKFEKYRGSTRTLCSKECIEIKESRLHPYSKPKKKINSEKKSLIDWQREAQLCGLSYGVYRMQVERFGKTFEELKRG